MNKLMTVTLVAVFAFFGNAHAAREKVTACPKIDITFDKGNAGLIIDEQNWKITCLGKFERAFVGLTKSDLIYCIYGEKNFAKLPMPKEYDHSSCSFDQNSIDPVTNCKNANPQACVIYCEKK